MPVFIIIFGVIFKNIFGRKYTNLNLTYIYRLFVRISNPFEI